MRIFVTGGTGFIGTPVVRDLLEVLGWRPEGPSMLDDLRAPAYYD